MDFLAFTKKHASVLVIYFMVLDFFKAVKLSKETCNLSDFSGGIEISQETLYELETLVQAEPPTLEIKFVKEEKPNVAQFGQYVGQKRKVQINLRFTSGVQHSSSSGFSTIFAFCAKRLCLRAFFIKKRVLISPSTIFTCRLFNDQRQFKA